METLHPSEIDLGLSRTQQVAKRLGLLHPQAKVITVAGTNGKGSCVAALSSLLSAAGFSCGAYTSPHLICYNERVRINGEQVTDTELCNAFKKINTARGNISLTYFEFGTLAAFEIFSQHNVDYWILEVGLGGRLDAVNIIDPDVAIITSIAIDHEQWLGHTREAIAIEKAGILRSGIPCICSEAKPPESLLKIIEANENDYYQIGTDFSLYGGQLLLTKRCMPRTQQQAEVKKWVLAEPRMSPASVAAACQALAVIDRLPPENTLINALANIALPGRFHRFEKNGRQFIVDVAHNPAATAFLAERIKGLAIPQLCAVVSMMADKDILGSLQALLPLVDHWYPSALDHISRAATVDSVHHALVESGVEPQYIHNSISVDAGLQSAVGHEPNATVLIFGSFYTVAQAYMALDVSLP